MVQQQLCAGKLLRILRNGAEVRVSPLHPPEDWSIFQRQQLGFPRTNNICEVFHSRWNSFVGHRQVNLFRFIKKLQAEEDRQMKQKQACRNKNSTPKEAGIPQKRRKNCLNNVSKG